MHPSLSRVLSLLIGSTVVVGMLFVSWILAVQYERSVLRHSERGSLELAGSVANQFESFLQSGDTKGTELYIQELKRVPDVEDLRILRVDGSEAFLDNLTIARINAHRGGDEHLPRAQEKRVQVILSDDKRLTQTLSAKTQDVFRETIAGSEVTTVLWPILNGKDCIKCHGGNQEILGVLKLTKSLATARSDLSHLRMQSLLLLPVILGVALLIMLMVLSRSIVRPIRALSSAMHRVSAGDLSQVVPVKGKDELASMAAGFNGVLEDLRHTYSVWQNEHDKLQTILSGSRDGIVVTDASGRIVMVNPAATVLLEKSTKAIVGNGFDALLDQPDRMREMLASETTTAEVMAYGQRVLALSVAAIRTDDRRLIGKAAILRDITEGKRMEQMLRTLSHTDGLTGLANRRMLDETLKTEVARAQSLPRDLSLMMFDIDHFKKFNDEFGHAQGDRVLKAVAEVAKNSVRNVDTACRYGGEEFVVILTETPLEGALILAERLRESVQNLRADGLQVTISVGVAGWCESGPTDPQELLSLADRALYISKNSGRNRVTAAPSKFAPVSDQGNDCL